MESGCGDGLGDPSRDDPYLFPRAEASRAGRFEMAVLAALPQAGGERAGRAATAVGATAAEGIGAVRTWLWILVALVVAMVAVGGATRLTGSGLSITEWKPVTGAVPPLSDAAWAAEFERYRQTPQYELLNRGMSLSEFKIIYAWEWGHRQLGRLIGLAFFVPLAVFWMRGRLSGRLALALLGLGALGGLQRQLAGSWWPRGWSPAWSPWPR
jgi:hypothetical protein